MRLKADGEFCVARDEAKDTTLWQLFLIILYLFDFIFPGIFLIDKLHNFEEEICFPNNGCLGKRKKTSAVATSKKCFVKNYKLIDLDHHWKIGLIKLLQVGVKCRNLKNVRGGVV